MRHVFEDHPHLGERMAGAATVVTGATFLGASIAHINEFLQAGAFIVAMLSGGAATAYYVKRVFGKDEE